MQRSMYGAFDSRLTDLLADSLANEPAAAGFEVHYQPIVRLDDKLVVAVEALARWRHSQAGEVPPSVFVALAERAGLMGVLDDFVLGRACADANALADAYGHEVDVHVNVSASRLGRADLDAAIGWALRRHRLKPGRLVIEITETAQLTDLEAAANCVRRVRDREVRVALDDFGAGFNMLAQLHALPVDAVKLDAMLINLDADGWRTEALCRSVLASCKKMSLTVIAEGVETRAQSFALRDMGCLLGQGNLYGPPLPLGQVAAHRHRLQRTRLAGLPESSDDSPDEVLRKP